jgi:hypothetical protein
MDPYIRAFFTAWLRLVDLNILDDLEEDANKSPLVKLKDDLLRFGVSLPYLVRLGWWITTPKNRRKKRGLRMNLALAKMLWELRERVGGLREAWEVILDLVSDSGGISQFAESFFQRYLPRFDLERSIVDTKKAEELEAFFTEKFPPLQPVYIVENGDDDNLHPQTIFDKDRTFADFESIGVDVRLTRANYRTGRLEISAFLKPVDFAIYLANHIWRWEKTPQKGFPLGSHRLHVPGNPNAIGAAMASGRFPGVLEPYRIEKIYPRNDPLNDSLYRILDNWLRDPEIGQELTQAYEDFINEKPEAEQDKLRGRWKRDFDRWVFSNKLREFFPQSGDTYVDGGAIDNTPSNSAIDSIREWSYLQNKSKSELCLDLYTILLHPEPMLPEDKSRTPFLYQVVKRTLDIQNAAKLTSDANVVSTIDAFGKRGQQLGEMLQIFIEAARDLDDNQQKIYMEKVRYVAIQNDEQKYLNTKQGESQFESLLSESAAESLKKIDQWSKYLLTNRLPLSVNVIDIYPDEMPLSTLQFTERFGYREQNAIKMITMGCFNTLWDLRKHLEEKRKDDRDMQDQRALKLARCWMGFEDWPKEADHDELEGLRQSWRCKRTKCVFHEHPCLHGTNRSGVDIYQP